MVHFSNFFRYMEEAEHALWRVAGMTIHPEPEPEPASPKLAETLTSEGGPKLAEGTASEGGPKLADNFASEGGWPRVAATCDFKTPLRFEDEFEVRVTLAAVSARTIKYAHEIVRGGEPIATGTVTVACVRRDVNGVRKAVEIPADVLERLRAVLQAP